MKEAIEILLQISEDQSVPRNIRRSATKSIEMLNDKSMELAVRAVNAIEELEDSTGDANTPFHTRTMIWQAITKLEIPRDKKEDQQRHLVWFSAITVTLFIIILMTPLIDESRVETLSGIAEIWVLSNMGVIGSFIGFNQLAKRSVSKDNGDYK